MRRRRTSINTNTPIRRALAPSGIAGLEGFADSLRLLIEREKYTISDIALMFCASRERIRQLAVHFGLSTGQGKGGGLFATRVWDDADHRFYPVSKGRLAEEYAYHNQQAFRAVRKHVREEYRKHFEATAVTVYARKQRPVTAGEVLREAFGRPVALNSAGPRVVALYGRQSFKATMRGIAERTGVVWAGRGHGTWNREAHKAAQKARRVREGVSERRARVRELRAQGMTYRAICDAVGYKSHASVKSALRATSNA